MSPRRRRSRARILDIPASLLYFLSFGSLAQLVEQRTLNPRVAGSIPARPTKIAMPPVRRHSYFKPYLATVKLHPVRGGFAGNFRFGLARLSPAGYANNS